MRLLIYILALTSAFFVSNINASDIPEAYPPEYLYPPMSPSSDRKPKLICEGSDGSNPESCYSHAGFGQGDGFWKYKIKPHREYPHTMGGIYEWCTNEWFGPNCNSKQYDWSWGPLIDSCPPTGFPDYDQPINWPIGTSDTMCAKLKTEPEPEPEKDCPAGYHSKAVSKAMGSDSCMPKECPAAGSGEDLYSSKMTGGVPFNGGGMYCNDGCAYSVKSENVTSDQYALGTSQGAACGDKPYDNKKLSDEGDEGQCETNTVDGVTIMFCNNEPAPPTDKDDDANNDGSKEDEAEKPKKDLEDCASDDNACMLRNLIKEQSNNTQVQIENDNKLHNKMVDTATNNTNILKTAIDDLHTTVFVGLQKNDKLEAVKASKMNDLISAVREGNQILTDKPIGGGGGGGNGGGDGEGEGGGDCEGGAADCVPIVGSEIPKEVVNLSQYADKYDDWLPNAELPEEKCIVLTTGQSLCFSFSAFIILFQAISGLIVISSLLHSARIIAGAI